MGLGSWCRRCVELMCVVLLPPLGVYLRHGCYSMGFWISVLLTILGYLLFFLEAQLMGYAFCVVNAVYVLVFVYRDDLLHNGNGDDDDDDEFAGATANLSYVFVA